MRPIIVSKMEVRRELSGESIAFKVNGEHEFFIHRINALSFATMLLNEVRRQLDDEAVEKAAEDQPSRIIRPN